MIGGAHVGYNLQINQWVVGLEGDVDGTDLTTTQFVGSFCPFFCGNVTTKANIQGSIRARLGVAFDRVLIYATGGGAFAEVKNFYNTNITIPPIPGVGPLFDTISKTRLGWTVGGGLEYAITNNWSVRAEYRYSDFGSFNDFSPKALFPNSFIRHHLTENQSRPDSATSSTAWRRLRSSRNIKPRAPASKPTKPGRAAGFIATSVMWRPFRGIPATVTGITLHTGQ